MDNSGGYSQHGCNLDNYHYMVFRGTTSADGSTITAGDTYTFREYAGGSATNSPYLFMQGGSNQAVYSSMGATGYHSNALGIGTQSPSYNLHVVGSFYSSGSSKEYKQNITDYKPTPGAIDLLKPVTYQYKDEWKKLGKNNAAELQIGLIAEDTAKVLPELGITIEELGQPVVRNVDYEKLSVILLAEVQDLRKRVSELEGKLNV